MAVVGETRVDLQHLLEDLRDAYTGLLEETILTEIVANALDSGAGRIRCRTDPAHASLTVTDDGRGMQRRELARYHDVAASTKARGEGIGFAGVGIKLGLLVSNEVVTETRRGATHVATRWHLASRHRAPWKWIPPPGLTGARGTAVRLSLANPLSPLLDSGYLEETLRRHFESLLDPVFNPILQRHYASLPLFEVDGRLLTHAGDERAERVSLAIRLGRRRTPSALGYLARHAERIPEDRQGVAVSTYGKVIKRGWEWLGVTPAVPDRVSGLVEAPDLAMCLTLSKNDFIRTGSRGATYLAYRKALQEAIACQLAAWGDTPDQAQRPRTVHMERDLERVLEDLVADFPLLGSLVERRTGGQRSLPMPGRGDHGGPGPLFTHGLSDRNTAGPEPSAEPSAPAEPPEARPPVSGSPSEAPPVPGDALPPEAAGSPEAAASLPTTSSRRRPARYGLEVGFEARPDDVELGRLVESTVWVNDAHPAYARALASRSLGYHIALTVALALSPLAVAPAEEHAFVTRFLSQWGASDRSRRDRGPRTGHRRPTR
jgi:hypothetical protein